MIYVNEPDLGGKEIDYLRECIETGWISSEGRFVRDFEDRFAERVTRRHGRAVTSGSVALDLALVAIGVGEGDRVRGESTADLFARLRAMRGGRGLR